jgi:DNA-binding beta-propeller fold protein YncE
LAGFGLLVPNSFAAISRSKVPNRFVPVSITAFTEGRFIVADYNRTYLVSPGPGGGYTLKDIPLISKIGTGSTSPVQLGWTSTYENPTGVYFDPGSKLLFIANYKRRDVLKVKLKGDPIYGEIIGRIAHPRMLGPENVHALNDFVAVADYDASAILMFDRTDRLVWLYPLELAHGVHVTDRAVYATGLGSTKLVKLDLRGKQIAAGGKNLIYPTHLAKNADGNITIIDANRGELVTVDQSLNLVSQFGSNGPSSEQFHRPYGFAHLNGQIAVADSYKSRVVILNGATRKLTGEVTVGTIMPVGRAVPYGNAPHPHCSQERVPEALAAVVRDAYGLPGRLKAYIGYQVICFLDGEQLHSTVLTPYPRFVFETTSFSIPLNFTWIHELEHEGRKLVVMGASDNESIILFDSKTETLHAVPLPSGLQIWGVDGTADGWIRSIAVESVRQFDNLVERCGATLPAYLLQHVPQVTAQNFHEVLARAFGSRADGTRLVEAWRKRRQADLSLSDAVSTVVRVGDALRTAFSLPKRSPKFPKLMSVQDAVLLKQLKSSDPGYTAKALDRCLRKDESRRE